MVLLLVKQCPRVLHLKDWWPLVVADILRDWSRSASSGRLIRPTLGRRTPERRGRWRREDDGARLGGRWWRARGRLRRPGGHAGLAADADGERGDGASVEVINGPPHHLILLISSSSYCCLDNTCLQAAFIYVCCYDDTCLQAAFIGVDCASAGCHQSDRGGHGQPSVCPHAVRPLTGAWRSAAPRNGTYIP